MMYGFGGPQQIPGMAPTMPSSGPKMAPAMPMGQPNIRSRIASLMGGGGNAVGASPLLRPTQPRQPMPISGGMGGPMRQMLR